MYVSSAISEIVIIITSLTVSTNLKGCWARRRKSWPKPPRLRGLPLTVSFSKDTSTGATSPGPISRGLNFFSGTVTFLRDERGVALGFGVGVPSLPSSGSPLASALTLGVEGASAFGALDGLPPLVDALAGALAFCIVFQHGLM